MIEGLRHAVFHYELDIEKLALLNEILNSRAKKLKDIENSLKISLKSGRMDAMADDYLTLIFYQYIELCNLYESKWRIDTSRLVPYKKVNRSSMAPTKASQGALYPAFYKTELINGSGGFGEGSTPNNRQVFDETMSHFDFLKESLEKLREGTLLPGEAVKVYSDIGVFFENQQVWFSKIKQEIKVVIRRLNNPINLSALRNA